jgi:GNAT superfamily N-acetyltransferase
VILRPASYDDAPAMSRILWDCFELSLPFLPQLHTRDEHVSYFRLRLMPEHEVWVAEEGGEVVGYIGFREGWIQHLFIHPDAQGRGLGLALLAKAMASGRPMQLWTFQQNTRARRFYEARGFRAVEFTDGEGNEEKTPDVRYAWEP